MTSRARLVMVALMSSSASIKAGDAHRSAEAAAGRAGRLARRVEQDEGLQFWLCQGAGWIGLCVVTYLSLTLWYSDAHWLHVGHTLVQAALGVAISTPLRPALRAARRRRPAGLTVIVVACVVGASAIWTVLRLLAFDWITGETDLWSDLGGWFFGSFMVFAAWTSLYFGLGFWKQLRAERTRARRAEAASRAAQLRMLRYQLQPHFLFNALNSVGALIATGRNDAAGEAVARLGELLRRTLSAEPRLRTPLSEEVEAARLYLDVERTRFGDRLSCRFHVAADAASALVPSLLLQPLLENAVKHGIERRTGPVELVVRARTCADGLLVEVADDGPGLGAAGEAGASPGFGIGLANTRERLAAQYGGAASLRLLPNEDGGVTARIVLPLERRAPPPWPAPASTHEAAPPTTAAVRVRTAEAS